jgi:hypothetical protein
MVDQAYDQEPQPSAARRRSSDFNLLQDETMMPHGSSSSQSAGLSSSPEDMRSSSRTPPMDNRSLTTGSYITAAASSATISSDDDGAIEQIQQVRVNDNNGKKFHDTFFEPPNEEIVFHSETDDDDDACDDDNEGEDEDKNASDDILLSNDKLLDDYNVESTETDSNNDRHGLHDTFHTSLQSDDAVISVYTAEDDYDDREEGPVGSEDEGEEPPPVAEEGEDEEEEVLQYENVEYKKCMGRMMLTDNAIEFYRWEECMLAIPWSTVVNRQVSPPGFRVPMLRIKTANEKNYIFRLADQAMANTLREDLKMFPGGHDTKKPLEKNDNMSHSIVPEQALMARPKASPLHEDSTSQNEASGDMLQNRPPSSQSSSYHSFDDDTPGPYEDPPIGHVRSVPGDDDEVVVYGDNEATDPLERQGLETERDKLLIDDSEQNEQEEPNRRLRGYIFLTCCCSMIVFLGVGIAAGYFIGRNTAPQPSESSGSNISSVPMVTPNATTTRNVTLAPSIPPTISMLPTFSTPLPTPVPNITGPTTLAPTRRGIPPRATPIPTRATATTTAMPTGENTTNPDSNPASAPTAVPTRVAGANATGAPTGADANRTTQPTASTTSSTLAPSVATSNSTLVPSLATETFNPTNTFPPTIDAPLLETLRGVSSDAGESLNTPGSPQNLASQWMLNEDTLTEGLSEDKQIQRYGLATFYYSTGGAAVWGAQRRQASSNDWLDVNKADCEWSFIVCNSDQEIVALDLIPPNAPMLIGTLPPEIGLWTSLTQFIINTGDAQEAAAARQFGELEKAQLSSRQRGTLRQQRQNETGVTKGMLTGPVPSEIGLLTLLETFQITNQALSESLPGDIGNATSLVKLDLTNNQLAGTVPLQLGGIGGIQEIRLGHNRFQATIKKGLFNREGGLAQSLSGLFLNNNLLRGTLPTEIGLLTNLESGLDLSSNTIQGTLPTDLGGLTKIKIFRINSNLFDGTLPSELQSWTQIEEFQIQDNSFTGEVTEDMCSAFAVFGTTTSADCDEITCTCCTLCCLNEVCTEV